MNNRFENISDNISIIQNISYIVVSIRLHWTRSDTVSL